MRLEKVKPKLLGYKYITKARSLVIFSVYKTYIPNR